MAQAVEQAQKQRELSKEALVADLDRLEARVRTELDVKSRLRRDGLRLLAVVGGAVVLVAAIVVLRSRLRRNEREDTSEPATLEDVAAELREIRKAVEKQRKGGGSFMQKVLLQALSSAGTAGGTLAARQLMSRQLARGEDTKGTPGGD